VIGRQQLLAPVVDDGVDQHLVRGIGVQAQRDDTFSQGAVLHRPSWLAGAHETHPIRWVVLTIYHVFHIAGSRVSAVEFSEQLAELRRQRGLTQRALAERIGVHANQLSRYESGLSEPSMNVLRKLAVALSVSADTLVFGGEDRLPDDEALRLAFEATTHLDADERSAVRTMLEGFLAAHKDRRGGEGPRSRRTKAT